MITAATDLLLAAGEGGGIHIPTMDEFFPPAIAFEGTIFEFNRVTFVRILATVVLCVVFWILANRARLVPGRAQSIAEMGLDFVRVNIAEEVLGKNHARPYVPLLTTMFFAIFALNITGVLPLLNISSNSVVAVPLLLAVASFVAFIVAGIRAHGVFGYVRTTLFPSGVPWPLYFILAPIEVLSTFILRPATLTIRLMSNMLAGHLLLVLFFAMTHYFFVEAGPAFAAVGVVTFGASIAFTVFEIFISALQAYIFTLLTAVYINLSQEAH
ncbi:ATP synthase F0F1 subunit A [Cellulomonas bogoriensis 69B4 = DSM 16987]|uniref:ATP synthase subunit a n=1 Tax=Cellulomonas bogoriensis 69B4 = DSM 16987 TaxID=1386082 RepID=A0A0A0C0R3_9CELL|nr:ATP synthase F0F1 subunit A [Cellulomonas bogoriensis 69B4 = DSM 16987]